MVLGPLGFDFHEKTQPQKHGIWRFESPTRDESMQESGPLERPQKDMTDPRPKYHLMDTIRPLMEVHRESFVQRRIRRPTKMRIRGFLTKVNSPQLHGFEVLHFHWKLPKLDLLIENLAGFLLLPCHIL